MFKVRVFSFEFNYSNIKKIIFFKCYIVVYWFLCAVGRFDFVAVDY